MILSYSLFFFSFLLYILFIYIIIHILNIVANTYNYRSKFLLLSTIHTSRGKSFNLIVAPRVVISERLHECVSLTLSLTHSSTRSLSLSLSRNYYKLGERRPRRHREGREKILATRLIRRIISCFTYI